MTFGTGIYENKVIVSSLLKKYTLPEDIKVDYKSYSKDYIVYNNGKKLRFLKHYFRTSEKNVCFSIMEMNKLLAKKL